MKLQPLICVHDVQASSRWYCALLGCESGHGGAEYERLNRQGELILQLHQWQVEHHHGPLGDPDQRPYGNGVLLWFELQDFDAAAQRADAMHVEVIKPRHISENGNREFWLRDPDGYTLVLTSPLGGIEQGSERAMQRLEGSCHCGAVRFEIETDFPELTQCDCSMCKRRNALMVKVHESRFRLLAGAEVLTEYQFHTHAARHYFCSKCGIYPFHRKRVTPDYFGVNVHCLAGFDPTGIPVRQAVGAAMQ